MKINLSVCRFYQDDEFIINLNKIYKLKHSGISDVYICRDSINYNITDWYKNSRCLNKVIDKYKDSTEIQLVNEEKENNSINTNIIVNETKPFSPFISLSGESNVFKLMLSCYSQGGTLEINTID